MPGDLILAANKPKQSLVTCSSLPTGNCIGSELEKLWCVIHSVCGLCLEASKGAIIVLFAHFNNIMLDVF